MTSNIRRAALALLTVLATLLAFAGGVSAQQGGYVLVGRIDSAIDPMSARVLSGWIEQAEARGASLFVLEIDTPGGLFDSMRDMTGALLDSPVPVAVIVTPSGSRAASAGTFIVAAGHVAAMTPGTTIGAASPVDSSGNDLPETIMAKASQDAAALLRGIAIQRSRNSDALESTIFESKSYTAEEAVELGIVDLTASNVSDMLAKIDGRAVKVLGSEMSLDTGDAVVESVQVSPVERFRWWLASPTLIFILLVAGGILVLVELISPGGWIPGAVGAGLLILAFVGIGSLPVNWIGLALMGAGLVLIFIELQAPGWGGFGAAGGAALLLGGFLLFGDSSIPGLPAPDMRVGWGALGGAGLFIALSVFGLMYFSRKAKSIHVESRKSQIVGQVGTVRSALSPTGTVYAVGELWSAESEFGDTIDSGENVIVSELDGVTLKVFRHSDLDSIDSAHRSIE